MNKHHIAVLLPALAALALAAGSVRPLAAIELSLEENRAERGNIGYIDMKRVFILFPETQRARESFEEAVRQAEEGVNSRKAELLRLKTEVAALKVDREALAKTPLPAPPPAPIPAPPSPKAAPAAEERKPELDALLASSGPATAVPAVPPSPVGSLPGFAGSSKTAPELPGGPAPETPALSAKLPPLAPAPALVPAPPAAPAESKALEERTRSLQELDDKIGLKLKELSVKEGSFREHQAAAEKSLLDLEGRKSEILLGKIHKAVQEVARKEGVSVVVDKGSILYGHNAVDLTDKVLKHLKGA
ncbi:MAG: OmpH family outer membrane protein [Elusimicrobiota bacterium]